MVFVLLSPVGVAADSTTKGTCADCFSGIIMSLLLWGRAVFPSHSRGLCQHYIQQFYTQHLDTELTSTSYLLYLIPPLFFVCGSIQKILKKAVIILLCIILTLLNLFKPNDNVQQWLSIMGLQVCDLSCAVEQNVSHRQKKKLSCHSL